MTDLVRKKVNQLTTLGDLEVGDKLVGERTSGTTVLLTYAGGGANLEDGDKGDVTVSSSGTVWTIDNDAVTYAKMQNVSATDKLLGRSTAGSGDVEEIACTAAGRALLDDTDAAAQRTTLGLGTLATQDGTFSGTSSGTNTGDQTSIVGITGTKAEFDAACSDGNFLYSGDVTQYTDEMAQDAVGAMVDSSLNYVDGTPLLQRAALTGDVTASAGSNATTVALPASATVDTDDKVYIFDTSASDAKKYVTAQSIRDLTKSSETFSSQITVGGNSSAAGKIDFLEDSDNGSNKIILTAPASIVTSDKTITLPDETGTMALKRSTVFKATLSSNQTVTSGVDTKVQCNTENFDAAGWYDNATNYRYTPQIAGKYLIATYLEATTNIANGAIRALIFKNGSLYSRVFCMYAIAATLYTMGSIVIDMNGTTDYIELYTNLNGTSVLAGTFITGGLLEIN